MAAAMASFFQAHQANSMISRRGISASPSFSRSILADSRGINLDRACVTRLFAQVKIVQNEIYDGLINLCF